MAKTLRDFVEEASALADVFFEPAGQMKAYFLVETPERKLTIIECEMSNGDEERAFRIGVPQKLRRAGYPRWCFFTEAWLASYEKDELPAVALPVTRPDRMEVVTFAAEDARTGERAMAARQIYRAPGLPARLMPLVFNKGTAGFVIGRTG